MDFATIAGLIVGFGAPIAAFLMEGGTMGGLLKISAFMIVFGGTLGALLISFPMKDVLAIPRTAAAAFKNKKHNMEELIVSIVKFAETARREGLLALEPLVLEEGANYDPMLKKGIQLVVDGTDPEFVKKFLELEVHLQDQHIREKAGIFEAAGGFSPTMGIIGTVMGLVHVLASLTNPDELGPAVAVAFVATLYGISFANLIWLPIGNKIKNNAKVEKIQRMLIIEGVLSIQSGENPRLIEEKLKAFIVGNNKKKSIDEAEEFSAEMVG